MNISIIFSCRTWTSVAMSAETIIILLEAKRLSHIYKKCDQRREEICTSITTLDSI